MLESWGRYPRPVRQSELRMTWRDEPLPPARPLLAYGRGRSYGDCCLNENGTLVTTRGLGRFISLDDNGILRCEAGVTLGEILEVAVPRGFFLAVVPGTKHVSVGGAIANDIHGKNHHVNGTFGRHVRSLELLRSDGRVECAKGEELFSATIGGMGLTGLITWAELELQRVPGAAIRVETIPFDTLDAFFELDEKSTAYQYTVAWIDSLRPGHGVFFRGDHAEGLMPGPRGRLSVPIDLPDFALNPLTVRAFNAAYSLVNPAATHVQHYDPFFFPLDGVERWNRIYGRRGLLQFQCVVPGRDAVRAVLDACARSRQASFLSVLKKFGDVPSPGLCSFPRPGFTIALDFANRGEVTFELFARLEALAMEAGGALYAAKDARMTKETFRRSYPRFEELEKLRDPAFSSSLWRRCAS